jgi:hypothetical protein
MLAFSLVGFWDNLYSNIGQSSNSDPKFIVHGLLCGAWMFLLFAQASLISAGNVRLHRTLGVAGMLIALGVTLSTIWVFIAVWKGWLHMGQEAKANRILLPSYSVFVTIAFINRKRIDWHRRLMYTGTLFMLGPILARCFDPLVVPFLVGWSEPEIESAFLPIFFSVWLAFFLSLFAYDAVTLKRAHTVTLVALAWFVIALTLSFTT